MDKILKRLRSAMTDVIINLPAPLILGFSRLQKAKTTQITTITSYCNLSTFSNHSQWSFFFFLEDYIFNYAHYQHRTLQRIKTNIHTSWCTVMVKRKTHLEKRRVKEKKIMFTWQTIQKTPFRTTKVDVVFPTYTSNPITVK